MPPSVIATDKLEDFATLFDATQPHTDAERALIAAYWVQIALGVEEFDSQKINTELKNLGHPIANITGALANLSARRPSLVLQTRKIGHARQARKRFKLTNAGIRRVQDMISANQDVSLDAPSE